MSVIPIWSMRLRDGEFLKCDKCKHTIEGNKEADVKVYLQHAIRADDQVGEVFCQKCYGEAQSL